MIAVFLICQSAVAQTEDRRVITVDGQAQVRVVPNQVILTLGIETFDTDLGIAKTNNDKRVTTLLGVTKSLGIARKDIKTDFLSIQPQYKDWQDRGNFLRYLVRKTVTITLRDITKFEALLSSVLEAGVDYVHGVDFQSTEVRRYRDEAQTLAIAVARENAEAVAQQLGQKIGKPRTIRVNDLNWRSSYGSWGPSRDRRLPQNAIEVSSSVEALTGPTTRGHIVVTARVTVGFELVD
jgi:uncharacterized protein YggE